MLAPCVWEAEEGFLLAPAGMGTGTGGGLPAPTSAWLRGLRGEKGKGKTGAILCKALYRW